MSFWRHTFIFNNHLLFKKLFNKKLHLLNLLTFNGFSKLKFYKKKQQFSLNIQFCNAVMRESFYNPKIVENNLKYTIPEISSSKYSSKLNQKSVF